MTPYFFIQGMKKGSNLTNKKCHTEKNILSALIKLTKRVANILMAEDLAISDETIEKGKPVGDVWYDIMSFQQIPTAKKELILKLKSQKPYCNALFNLQPIQEI